MADRRLVARRREPPSLVEFLRDPTREEWDSHLEDGWAGPDGSSSSLDDVEGIRIGVTSRDWKDRRYAANLHDWRYRMGRHWHLGPKYRKAADLEHHRLLVRHVSVLVGWRAWVARRRCTGRYYALRWFGRRAFRG